ncbi:hypothetical protein VIN01S_35090 [Vibrio inusitatus NBRC 102082]|uniref:Chalcone isomerase domain-containing protein n=1 Tax=Vibrio inusitatus NBRC 102082 TaxID=1219070 RepID=A0A4Y3I0E0_9VIBR|nr:chalcone isomerase family protein [Vibrio inusitatus]GEA52705.1 hypothetical protein VIN01S_35090 [Vibrio inusitatus NBRC 102082]
MNTKSLLLLCIVSLSLPVFAENNMRFASDNSESAWSYSDYQDIAFGTRTTWFVDYYTMTYKKDEEGNTALILTFLPEQLTQKKVGTAFVEALEKSNPGINTSDVIIDGLIDQLSISLSRDDTVVIIERGNQIQIQHNQRVIYQFSDAGGQKQALLNIWLGEKPVDDFLTEV